MRAGTPRYPVDRYLVESSKKIEIVNILDDEVWNSAPALRPEDEIILRKLHEMLQSTADDLKLLSGELSKFHESGVQVKTQPTPLDEEFNEKVHIEELVNAKFNGYKIIDKPVAPSALNTKTVNDLNSLARNLHMPKVNTGVQVNAMPVVKKPVINRNLGITRTKVIEIDEKDEGKKKVTKLNNGQIINNLPAVAYNEFSFKYVEPDQKLNPLKDLQIQDMPRINIRSELKAQKVLQLDIIPENIHSKDNLTTESNVAVVAIQYESDMPKTPKNVQIKGNTVLQCPQPEYTNKQPVRKVSKMSTYDSSGSTNNISSDTQHKLKTQKQIKNVIRSSPKTSARIDRSKNKVSISKKETEKRSRPNLDEWKRKLNIVYGLPSSSRNSKVTSKTNLKKASPKKPKLPPNNSTTPKPNILNNAEYIPYSQLTLGGVKVSDIEREIANIPNKNDVPLSPILDKILSSRENSFQNDSPKKRKKDSPKILTTSDENLLQEVIDIERTVSKTISKNLKKKLNKSTEKLSEVSSESKEASETENESYADDFEDDKSDNTQNSEKRTKQSGAQSEQHNYNKHSSDDNDEGESEEDDPNSDENAKKTEVNKSQANQTYTKALNLSFKNTVDVFEFVHEVDTQDTATQSNTTHKISLKETQTSPRNDKPNIKPIRNDLWPSMDPRGEVEKMFELEKDFIKKLIIDEYGDLLEKNLTKPSTSKEGKEFEDKDRNIVAFQKNTQTSPAHVKSVMTSPTRTKTRTTSPFVSLTVDHQTSPLVVVTNEHDLNIEVDDDEEGISVNLSSPRFSLRLPQTSREVLSNLEVSTPSKLKNDKNSRSSSKVDKIDAKTFRKGTISSSSVDGDKSSSEISSLGEVNWKLKRRIRKSRIPSMSESSSSSNVSKYSSDIQSGGILPLRSEGELSIGQIRRNITSKSEGETSFGQL